MDPTHHLLDDHRRQVLDAAHRRAQVSGVRFARCRAASDYAPGATPVRQPGAPVGWAAVLLGFADRRDLTQVSQACARSPTHLSGRRSVRRPDPTTAAAGRLAALVLVCLLGAQGWHPSGLTC